MPVVNPKDCPGYNLVQDRLAEIKLFSNNRDEESERSIMQINNRLDIMEINNEKGHQKLNDKIDKVEDRLTHKIDKMEDNIGKKIDDGFKINSGKKAIAAWKVILGIAGSVVTALIIAFLIV